MSFNLSESLTIIYFLFFFPQALPTADPAHFLWRGCNGSALCRCWLNMEGKPSLYQTLILSTGEKSCSPPTSLVWYLSFNKESTSLWYHYTKKQTSVKTSALYGWMKGTPSPSSDRTFVWKQILPELNIEGIKRDCMDICYQIVLNCGSDNHVFFFAHTFTQVHLMYLLNTRDIIGPSSLKCIQPYCYCCASSVSDVAAAYLLEMRQAPYSVIRCAPLNHFVLLRTKCQEVRMVCYTSIRSTPKYFFFFLFVSSPHSTICTVLSTCWCSDETLE